MAGGRRARRHRRATPSASARPAAECRSAAVAHDRKFRFGVHGVDAPIGARSSREQARDGRGRSGTRRCSCPTTSSTTRSAPIAGDGRRGRGRRPRCASASLVLGNDYKHPVVLAQRGRDHRLLSDGRLELGIGAGWMTVDYEKAGIPLDRPGVRIARLAESIAVLKGLLADGPFTFHGRALPDHRPRRACRSRCSSRTRRSSSAAAGRRSWRSRRARRHIVGINANLRGGVAASDRTRRTSMTPAATDEKLATGARRRRRPLRRPRDPDVRRLRALHRRPRRSIAEAMAPVVRRRRPTRRSRRPVGPRRHARADDRRRSSAARAVADELPRRRRRRDGPVRAGRGELAGT